MTIRRVMFSPVTRLEGFLSVEIFVGGGRVVEANAGGTMFRGYEWIMRDRHVTDAVYMTQRVSGICSTAHGAVASYLLDELYDNDLSENAQLLRNIMYASDIVQNHIRHFYLFSIPDFVRMPDRPPFHGQNLGPLARMIINGKYRGGSSTMDRISARTLEALLFTELIEDWLKRLKPGPPPISQKKTPVKSRVVATTDAMRGALLHSALIENEEVVKYNIITPTVWNFSPKDKYGPPGPLEKALIGAPKYQDPTNFLPFWAGSSVPLTPASSVQPTFWICAATRNRKH